MLGFPALPRQVQMQNRLVTGEAGSSDHGVLSFDMMGIPVGPGGKRVLDDLNARVPFDHLGTDFLLSLCIVSLRAVASLPFLWIDWLNISLGLVCE